jgi:hypothetical protein
MWMKIYSTISWKLRSKGNPALQAASGKYLVHPKRRYFDKVRSAICVFRFRRLELGKFAFIFKKGAKTTLGDAIQLLKAQRCILQC